MDFEFNNYKISLLDEPNYIPNSADNLRKYNLEYYRDSEYLPAAAHGIILESEVQKHSAILLGTGGTTGIHEDSLAFNNNLVFVATGDSSFALELPSLKLLWSQQADEATCFGVYWVKEQKCLIVWGELAITRINSQGEILWSYGGADIFTEGFTISNNIVNIIDFNGKQYRLNIATGRAC